MHFSVLVIGECPEAQLAPFDESQRTSFNDLTKDYKKEYRTKTAEAVIFADGRVVSKYSDKIKPYRPQNLEKAISNQDTLHLPEGAELKEVPFRQIYKSFAEFVKDWHGAERNANGRYGYWYNPNAKWDWYQLGGRWKNKLPLKNGTDANSANWCDVDKNKLSPTAAVLFEGRWYQTENCFWASDEKEEKRWGKEFKNIIKTIQPNMPVAIYDCHI